jgi:hypothetical protein
MSSAKASPYLTPLLPLLIASGLAATEPREKRSPTERENKAEEEFDAFFAKIEPRKRLILKQLKTGPRKPWEGVFYDGSPFHGLAQGWIISHKAGYVSTTRRIDMGKVEVQGNQIALVSESPGKPWGLQPVIYVVVPWGARVYLVKPNFLLTFCNDVNAGRLPSGSWGLYPLRIEDFNKKVTGLPQVPKKYRKYLLKKPIKGRIIKRHGKKGDVAVRGEEYLLSGFSVTLNVGKNHGVRTGMKFYPVREKDREIFKEIYVISGTRKRCELLVCGVSTKGKKRFKRGMRLTTRNPLCKALLKSK